MKNIMVELLANIAHAFHAIRHGVVKHRRLTFSVKAPGKYFYTVQHIECECGKVFATVKENQLDKA